MTTPPAPERPAASAGLSFAHVADAYDRARPGYPAEAVAWLAGGQPRPVLELGAGTGKLTGALAALGHRVVALDPLAPMLAHLTTRVPDALVVQGAAEHVPLPDRSVDLVVSAQAFHWFDHQRALPEIARVLRPGGVLALVWNTRDERIPWVRRLGQLIGNQDQEPDPTHTLLASGLFGFVEQATFRFWQQLDRDLLRELVASRSNVATLPESARDRLLSRVDALYAEYGRGPDGMLLPYRTRCFKTVVRPRAQPEGPDPAADRRGSEPPDPEDDGSLLIDFS